MDEGTVDDDVTVDLLGVELGEGETDDRGGVSISEAVSSPRNALEKEEASAKNQQQDQTTT